MTKKNVVTVTIQGAEYTLRTETSPEHTLAVAAYVDGVISEIAESKSAEDRGENTRSAPPKFLQNRHGCKGSREHFQAQQESGICDVQSCASRFYTDFAALKTERLG